MVFDKKKKVDDVSPPWPKGTGPFSYSVEVVTGPLGDRRLIGLHEGVMVPETAIMQKGQPRFNIMEKIRKLFGRSAVKTKITTTSKKVVNNFVEKEKTGQDHQSLEEAIEQFLAPEKISNIAEGYERVKRLENGEKIPGYEEGLAHANQEVVNYFLANRSEYRNDFTSEKLYNAIINSKAFKEKKAEIDKEIFLETTQIPDAVMANFALLEKNRSTQNADIDEEKLKEEIVIELNNASSGLNFNFEDIEYSNAFLASYDKFKAHHVEEYLEIAPPPQSQAPSKEAKMVTEPMAAFFDQIDPAIAQDLLKLQEELESGVIEEDKLGEPKAKIMQVVNQFINVPEGQNLQLTYEDIVNSPAFKERFQQYKEETHIYEAPVRGRRDSVYEEAGMEPHQYETLPGEEEYEARINKAIEECFEAEKNVDTVRQIFQDQKLIESGKVSDDDLLDHQGGILFSLQELLKVQDKELKLTYKDIINSPAFKEAYSEYKKANLIDEVPVTDRGSTYEEARMANRSDGVVANPFYGNKQDVEIGSDQIYDAYKQFVEAKAKAQKEQKLPKSQQQLSSKYYQLNQAQNRLLELLEVTQWQEVEKVIESPDFQQGYLSYSTKTAFDLGQNEILNLQASELSMSETKRQALSDNSSDEEILAQAQQLHDAVYNSTENKVKVKTVEFKTKADFVRGDTESKTQLGTNELGLVQNLVSDAVGLTERVMPQLSELYNSAFKETFWQFVKEEEPDFAAQMQAKIHENMPQARKNLKDNFRIDEESLKKAIMAGNPGQYEDLSTEQKDKLFAEEGELAEEYQKAQSFIKAQYEQAVDQGVFDKEVEKAIIEAEINQRFTNYKEKYQQDQDFKQKFDQAIDKRIDIVKNDFHRSIDDLSGLCDGKFVIRHEKAKSQERVNDQGVNSSIYSGAFKEFAGKMVEQGQQELVFDETGNVRGDVSEFYQSLIERSHRQLDKALEKSVQEAREKGFGLMSTGPAVEAKAVALGAEADFNIPTNYYAEFLGELKNKMGLKKLDRELSPLILDLMAKSSNEDKGVSVDRETILKVAEIKDLSNALNELAAHKSYKKYGKEILENKENLLNKAFPGKEKEIKEVLAEEKSVVSSRSNSLWNDAFQRLRAFTAFKRKSVKAGKGGDNFPPKNNAAEQGANINK